MKNLMVEAFGAHLAQNKDMMLNAAEAFEAGWNAAMDYCMQPIDKKAPVEGATSIQRKGELTTTIIDQKEAARQ